MITPDSTIQEYLEYWITPACTPQLSEISRVQEKQIIDKRIIPFIGDTLLRSYCPDTVRSLELSWNQDERYSPACRIAMRILRTAMRYARNHTLINDVYEDCYHIPRRSLNPVQIYTPEQIQSIFIALRCHPMRNFYKLIYYTLIRGCEAKALRISDISFSSHQMHICRELHGSDSRNAFFTPSSEEKNRKIYLSPQVEEVIKDELELREKKTTGMQWHNDYGDILFVRNTGNPCFLSTMGEEKAIVSAVTGIEGFSTASLRLTGISVMLDNNVSPITIKNILGISSLKNLKRMEAQIVKEEELL